MLKITIVCVDAGGGHACGLAIGLKKYGDVTAVWQNKNKHGLDYLVPDAKFGFEHIPPKGDDLVIVSCITYDRLKLSNYDYKRTHIVITDGKFPRTPDYYNNIFNFRGFDVLTTGCKRHFREPHPVKTYYQPFDLSHIDQTKNDKLTITHSPFVSTKYKEKGTDEIINVCNDKLDLITGVSWDECLQRKAKSHIFVDQIDHYDRDKFKFKSPDYVWPALGKSGIEAMHLGCCVITYGKGYNTEIPAPPVVWVTKETFREKLDYYIHNRADREELAQRGREWALKYASYDFAAQNVLR